MRGAEMPMFLRLSARSASDCHAGSEARQYGHVVVNTNITWRVPDGGAPRVMVSPVRKEAGTGGT